MPVGRVHLGYALHACPGLHKHVAVCAPQPPLTAWSFLCAWLQGNKEWAHNTVHGAAGHAGRVLALQPSPFFPDALLAVGDCGFAVWRILGGGISTGDERAEAAEVGDGGSGGADEGRSRAGSGGGEALLPIFESRFPDALYSCGCWSPSKPGGW